MLEDQSSAAGMNGKSQVCEKLALVVRIGFFCSISIIFHDSQDLCYVYAEQNCCKLQIN